MTLAIYGWESLKAIVINVFEVNSPFHSTLHYKNKVAVSISFHTKLLTIKLIADGERVCEIFENNLIQKRIFNFNKLNVRLAGIRIY